MLQFFYGLESFIPQQIIRSPAVSLCHAANYIKRIEISHYKPTEASITEINYRSKHVSYSEFFYYLKTERWW
jgi:hypothetical protein